MTRNDAFLLLSVFRRRALPGLLRKLRLFKGLDPQRHRDLVDDLHQELWLDCLEHSDEIVALDPRERHARWFRLLERFHYRMATRDRRQIAADSDVDQTLDKSEHADPGATVPSFDPVRTWGAELPAPRQRFLRQLAESAVYLKNGRLNCRESARSLGLRPQDLTEAWCVVAADLGLDDEFLGFWRRRLGEALVGLGADLLRDAGLVHIHGEAQRRRPDPLGRLRRIRRLRRHLSGRPLPKELRHVLARYLRVEVATLDPVAVLTDAADVTPEDPAVHLWCFEAALATGDFDGATRSLKRAERSGGEGIPILLARGRLLEARGDLAAALRLLELSPHRRDERVALAIRRLSS